ncbi:MAG: iron-sulfur cluster assembly accessory protein [Nitrospirae bacterium]|nr:MAG: HesB/YadR/YfhF family protein [Nitrospirota bacterium]MBI5205283.1 iron-sulfur cluster assembly accessory protein [Nitrospirota bacterium]
MITITDVAAEKAKQLLTAEGKAEWGLRVYSAEGGCCGPSYGMDIDEKPGEGDEVIEKNGLKVFIDKNTCQKLDGMGIDFVDDGERQGFVLTGGKAPSCSSSGCSSCG